MLNLFKRKCKTSEDQLWKQSVFADEKISVITLARSDINDSRLWEVYCNLCMVDPSSDFIFIKGARATSL